MRATVPYLEERFDEYNRLMFGGELPRIPLLLSKAKGYLGTFTYKRTRSLWRETESDYKIRISTRVDMEESDLQDILIHEMIHYYIHYKKIKDTSAHGKVFRAMMNGINSRFGRHIRISYRLNGEQRRQAGLPPIG